MINENVLEVVIHEKEGIQSDFFLFYIFVFFTLLKAIDGMERM